MADEPDIALMEELEYEGQGGEEQGEISGYVQGLAQEVSQQLESWMEDGALTDSMLEPMIELLKQVFVDFEHYYVQSQQVDQLTEEKETLQQSLSTMKQKYQSTVERHNAYVDQLEQENREEKRSAHQLREVNADLKSRLTTAKSSLEELQEVHEQAKTKHKEESRKLYNAVEFYRSSGERREQVAILKRSSRSRSTKAKVEMAQSLAITSSGIPLIPGANRSFSPDPVSHEEETSSLAMSERSSVGQQLGAAREQATNETSLQKELDTLQKSHGDAVPEDSVSSLPERTSSFEENQPTRENDELSDENETSEGDQELLLESGQQIESSGNWVEVENTGREVAHRVTAHSRRPPALSLAQEFELLAPEEFAQTEMQQILEERDEAVHEKEKLELDKQKILTDLEAFRNQNMELKKIIEECKAKEEAISEELSSARRDREKAIQESLPDEDLGSAFAFTKKEMFIKIKELMQVKKRCHFLEEDNRNLQKLLNEKKTPKQKSLFSAILDKVFGRSKSTPHHDIHVKEQKTPVRTTVYKRSVTPTSSLSMQSLQGVSLEGYTLCNNWLLGYRANGVMSSLPDYVGRILLKGLEISRIDYCAVARVSKDLFTPDSSPIGSVLSTSPGTKPSKPSITAGPTSRGQCIAEVWVATSFESVSHIEVISVLSPTEKQVQRLFMTNCQHIQCMMAVPGCVPQSEEYRKRSRASLSPPPVTELSLVSDNKDPLRKESVSPVDRTDEELVMWIVSETNKLHFHYINKDCHREVNSVDLQRRSFCIEYAGDRVFIGQSNGNLMIFSRSKDDNYMWNIDKPFVVGISCPPPEQEMQEINITYIKNIRKKLWIALGQAIYIMDPQQLGIEVCNDDNRIIIDESKDNKLGTFINCIEEVQDLAVISFYKRSVIKVYDSANGNYIKRIDISSVCVILDKLPASPSVGHNTARITTLSSNLGILYVGTRCGKLFAFSAKTLSGDLNEDSGGEDSPDGRKKRKKLKKLAEAAEKEREEARMEYEKQLVEDINSCAISVYMHKFSMRGILCMPLPTPSQPNVPVVYNSLVVSVGKGHYHQATKSSSELARSSSPSDRLSDHCQLLVWGCQKEDKSTAVS